MVNLILFSGQCITVWVIGVMLPGLLQTPGHVQRSREIVCVLSVYSQGHGKCKRVPRKEK